MVRRISFLLSFAYAGLPAGAYRDHAVSELVDAMARALEIEHRSTGHVVWREKRHM